MQIIKNTSINNFYFRKLVENNKIGDIFYLEIFLEFRASISQKYLFKYENIQEYENIWEYENYKYENIQRYENIQKFENIQKYENQKYENVSISQKYLFINIHFHVAKFDISENFSIKSH